MAGQFILAIDQGTTGTTVLVLDRDLKVRARVNREFRQIYPQPGWVEHDPEEIWASTLHTVTQAVQKAGLSPTDVAAVGITNQRETTVVWDRATGKPLYNAIVWQDRRTASLMEGLKAQGLEDSVRAKTGLVLDPYFSGSKLGWILDHVEGARQRAQEGELAFGTIDTWLLWKLTGGASHKTDVSNASRTLLMDLHTQQWDDALLSMFHVPRAVLPEICGNAEVFGVLQGVPGLSDGIPVAGMAGDQQAALFGQVCFEAGEAKCTFGTGAFLLMNTGSKVVPSSSGLLSTAAWKINGTMNYALEGSAFIAGAAVQWLRDGLGFFSSSEEIEAMALSVEDNGGVVFVPALTGLGAPHWNPDARGLFWGMTRGTTRGHIARATLEAIALQNVDILLAMQKDLGHDLKSLKVDGGASANNLLMQFQCDLLDCPLVRPSMTDTTALGSGLMAGLAVGLFEDMDAIRETWREDRGFTPSMTAQARQAHMDLWAEGLRRV